MNLRKIFGITAIVGIGSSLIIGMTTPDIPEEGVSGKKEPLSMTQKVKKGLSLVGFASMAGMYLSPRKEESVNEEMPKDDNSLDLS